MAPALNFRTSDWNPRPAILDQGSGSERMDLYKENRSKIYLGGIPDPLIVESEGLQGSVHKNEQITISLLVGGDTPKIYLEPVCPNNQASVQDCSSAQSSCSLREIQDRFFQAGN